MPDPVPTTLMSIDDIDFSPWATRGITMALSPIATGSLERDVNGNLVDLTLPQFRKYAASITCTDHEAPTLNDVWRGKIVTVACLPQLGIDESNSADSAGQVELQMMVDQWETSREEWEASTAWSMTLLEI